MLIVNPEKFPGYVAFARFEVRPEPSKAVAFCKRRERTKENAEGKRGGGRWGKFLIDMFIVHCI